MANEILKYEPLEEVSIDEGSFLQSLISSAFELEIIGQKEIERFQLRLLELLSYISFKYNKGESSSLMEDTAKRIADSAVYLLSLKLKTFKTRTEALDAVLNGKLTDIYEEGVVIAKKLLVDSKKQYNALVGAFVTCGNVALSTSIKKTVRLFLQRYGNKASFFAHEIPTFIEYDTFLPIKDVCGIEYISEYLMRISIENEFLKIFSGRELLKLFAAFDKEYKDSVFSLFEVALNNSISALLIGKTAGTLLLDEKDREDVRNAIDELDEGVLFEAVGKLFDAFDVPPAIAAYCLSDTEKLLGLLKSGGVVFLSTVEEITPIRVKLTKRMDGIEFGLFLEELQDSETKALLLKNSVSSLDDIVEILTGDILTEEEIFDYFDMLPSVELSALYSFSKNTDIVFLIDDFLLDRDEKKAESIKKYSSYIKFI